MEENGEPQLHWKVLPFSNLTALQWHDAAKVRIDVFVVEQECAYHELDGHDPDCHHIIGLNDAGRVVATARVANAEVIYEEATIGRVAVLPEYRGLGLGYEIMNRGIELCRDGFNAPTVKIAAQYYLEKFYKQLGFETISGIYPWDGIDHVDMRLTFGKAG